MDSYQIIMTSDATTDLVELRNYISYALLAPDTAASYIQTIRQDISKLSEMPQRIKLIDEEPWHLYGIRRFITKNFFVYYRIDEEEKKVYILNIIYSKRNQLRALKQMSIN